MLLYRSARDETVQGDDIWLQEDNIEKQEIPEKVHTGPDFSKRLNVSEHAPAPPNLVPDEDVTKQQQPPLIPADDRTEPLPVPIVQQDSLQTPLHCEPGCCTRVGPRQERKFQPTRAPTPPPAPVTVNQTPPAVYQPPPVPANVYQPPPAPQAYTSTSPTLALVVFGNNEAGQQPLMMPRYYPTLMVKGPVQPSQLIYTRQSQLA